MSSRSLNGGELTLRNLEVTEDLKVKDLAIENLKLSNLDISEELIADTVSADTVSADTVHTQHLKCASNIDIEGSHSYVHVNTLIGINATVSDTANIQTVVSTDVSTNELSCNNAVITGDLTVGGNIIHESSAVLPNG